MLVTAALRAGIADTVWENIGYNCLCLNCLNWLITIRLISDLPNVTVGPSVRPLPIDAAYRRKRLQEKNRFLRLDENRRMQKILASIGIMSIFNRKIEDIGLLTYDCVKTVFYTYLPSLLNVVLPLCM